MAKLKQIETSDFDFLKRPIKIKTYFFEKFFATAFISGFIALLVLSPTIKQSDLNPIQEKQVYNNQDINNQNISPKYLDYNVTQSDKNMFESIFEYNESFSFNKDMDFFQYTVKNKDLIYKTDLINAKFDNKQKISVKSTILSIEPSDKNFMVKSTGNPNLDYVDLVLQKTYSQNKISYSEQQMVSLSLDNHKIVSITTTKMID